MSAKAIGWEDGGLKMPYYDYNVINYEAKDSTTAVNIQLRDLVYIIEDPKEVHRKTELLLLKSTK